MVLVCLHPLAYFSLWQGKIKLFPVYVFDYVCYKATWVLKMDVILRTEPSGLWSASTTS